MKKVITIIIVAAIVVLGIILIINLNAPEKTAAEVTATETINQEAIETSTAKTALEPGITETATEDAPAENASLFGSTETLTDTGTGDTYERIVTLSADQAKKLAEYMAMKADTWVTLSNDEQKEYVEIYMASTPSSGYANETTVQELEGSIYVNWCLISSLITHYPDNDVSEILNFGADKMQYMLEEEATES